MLMIMMLEFMLMTVIGGNGLVVTVVVINIE